jgi:hypothetical protein
MVTALIIIAVIGHIFTVLAAQAARRMTGNIVTAAHPIAVGLLLLVTWARIRRAARAIIVTQEPTSLVLVRISVITVQLATRPGREPRLATRSLVTLARIAAVARAIPARAALTPALVRHPAIPARAVLTPALARHPARTVQLATHPGREPRLATL